jgi:hypothetical protein
MNILNLKNSILSGALLLVLSFVLIGCQAEVINSEKIKEVQVLRKSGPVEVNSTVAKHLSANVYSPVVLSFKLNSFRENVVVTLQPSQGLSIAGSLDEFTLGIAEIDSEEEIALSVLAETEGLYYLNIFVEAEVSGTRSIQTAVVPILVGDKSAKSYLKKNGAPSEDSEGRPVVVMPAYEPAVNKDGRDD